jgi:protein-disulfide isomerase
LTRLERLDGILRDIQARLDELSAAIRGGTPPSPVESVQNVQIVVRDALVRGSSDAHIALVEYSDFECPFCGQHSRTAYPELLTAFVDTGRIKYVLRHLPLERLHPRAFDAAVAAECAGDNGRFWEMHDRLFAAQEKLAKTDLLGHAQALQLDVVRFETCLSSARTRGIVKDDLDEANRLGITGTPTFFVGELVNGTTLRATRKIVGAQPFGVFRTVLDEVLASQL